MTCHLHWELLKENLTKFFMELLLYVLAFYQTWSHSKIIFVARVIMFLVQTAQTEIHLGAAHFEKSYLPHFKSNLHVFYMCGNLFESTFV